MPEFHTFTLQEQLQTLFSASLYLYLADREFVSQSFQRVLMGSSRNWSRIKAIRATFLAAVNDMQKELGRPPEKKFAYFDANVFAAASLGQVHAAGNR